MTDRRLFILMPLPHPSRENAKRAIDQAPDGYELAMQPARRNTDQNARMWAQLADVSRQVEWYGKRLTSEDWKHVFSASLRALTVVPNLDGTGFVALGLSTSAMSKREMADLIDLVTAFGNERGVVWSEPERQAA